MAYAVVRTDNLSGIIDGSKLATAKYYVSTTPTAIENGTVLALDSIDTSAPERFTWKATAAGADKAADGTLILVATPEVIKDKKYFALDEFTNPADGYLRGYVLEQGDVFSVTVEAFTSGNQPAVGNNVALAANGKLAKDTSTPGKFAKCLKIETVGNKTFYVLRCL